MLNTIQLNKCINNNGKHVIRVQQPVKCSVFGTYGPAIRKCVNCELHFPLKGGRNE